MYEYPHFDLRHQGHYSCRPMSQPLAAFISECLFDRPHIFAQLSVKSAYSDAVDRLDYYDVAELDDDMLSVVYSGFDAIKNCLQSRMSEFVAGKAGHCDSYNTKILIALANIK